MKKSQILIFCDAFLMMCNTSIVKSFRRNRSFVAMSLLQVCSHGGRLECSKHIIETKNHALKNAFALKP